MEDQQIQLRIAGLIDEEHRLREMVSRQELDRADEQRRLAEIEENLDQCWDLLRQRRARRDVGEDPDLAEPRPVDVVEDYEQ
jgi:septation ring formation regulator EzrA